jgi:hypothetical protein
MKKLILIFIVLLFISCSPSNKPEDIYASYMTEYGEPVRTSHYIGYNGYESYDYTWESGDTYISISVGKNPMSFRKNWYLFSEYYSKNE